MNDIDISKLRQLIKEYKFYSKPSNGDHSSPCTVRDINKVIDNTANLFTQFLNEIEG